MRTVVVVVHITVFGSIAVTEDLIDCDSPVDYIRLVTPRVAVEIMIGLDAGVFSACVNVAGGVTE